MLSILIICLSACSPFNVPPLDWGANRGRERKPAGDKEVSTLLGTANFARKKIPGILFSISFFQVEVAKVERVPAEVSYNYSHKKKKFKD